MDKFFSLGGGNPPCSRGSTRASVSLPPRFENLLSRLHHFARKRISSLSGWFEIKKRRKGRSYERRERTFARVKGPYINALPMILELSQLDFLESFESGFKISCRHISSPRPIQKIDTITKINMLFPFWICGFQGS